MKAAVIERRGICLPDDERHFVDMIDRGPVVHGRGTYQLAKWQRCQQVIHRRENAIDIGAHVGLWTIQLMHFFSGVVYCFEPCARHIECWFANTAPERTASATATPLLVPTALGATSGQATLRTHAGSSGHTYIDPEPEGPSERVDVRTLDSFDLHNIGFIKIDVEGYERFVLDGAIETLRRERPVVCVEQKQAPTNAGAQWRSAEMASRYGLGDTDAIALLEDLGAHVVAEISGDYVMAWQ